MLPRVLHGPVAPPAEIAGTPTCRGCPNAGGNSHENYRAAECKAMRRKVYTAGGQMRLVQGIWVHGEHGAVVTRMLFVELVVQFDLASSLVRS